MQNVKELSSFHFAVHNDYVNCDSNSKDEYFTHVIVRPSSKRSEVKLLKGTVMSFSL